VDPGPDPAANDDEVGGVAEAEDDGVVDPATHPEATTSTSREYMIATTRGWGAALRLRVFMFTVVVLPFRSGSEATDEPVSGLTFSRPRPTAG